MLVSTDNRSDRHQRLLSQVVAGGYCIGCGACAYATNSRLSLGFDKIGRLQAFSSPLSVVNTLEEDRRLDRFDPNLVCPFSSSAATEDQLAASLFPQAQADASIGRYLKCYAGHVLEHDFRKNGGSGGVAKWLLVELLRQRMVDAVIQVRVRSGVDGPLYEYAVFDDVKSAIGGSKSAYYPIEMSGVLEQVANVNRTYAIVGLPCFIKAIRLIQRNDQVIRERIAYCVGLVCGHLKTTRYAESLAWQSGIHPSSISEIDFRVKLPSEPANQKGFRVRGGFPLPIIDRISKTREFLGGDYNDCFFRYEACEFCDDVVAETADIAIGDAWLPEYVSDGNGANVFVIRNQNIQSLISAAISQGRINAKQVSPEDIKGSQAGGLRDRREGLAYRLYLKDKDRTWRPPKRVVASKAGLGVLRTRIYELRSLLSSRSHESFSRAREKNDLAIFIKEMNPLITKYRRLQQQARASWKPSFVSKMRVQCGRLMVALRIEKITANWRAKIKTFLRDKMSGFRY
jgi:coenzyme F420 hydrogenase subunit beta